MRIQIRILMLLICGLLPTHVYSQNQFLDFDVNSIYDSLEQSSEDKVVLLADSWWSRHVVNSQRRVEPYEVTPALLMQLAVNNSNRLKIASDTPVIRSFAITEADSFFDWSKYVQAGWDDISLRVSTSLIAGGNVSQFDDHIFQVTGGLSRNTRTGGQFNVSQKVGWQDNNSEFFIPDNQATGQMTLSFTQPLLRGRGQEYNNGNIYLAQLDSEVARHEFQVEVQNHVMEVARAYWAIYLERSLLAQQVRLYLLTREIYEKLSNRREVDAQKTQVVTLASALESRRSDLIRARTAVTNAETRLRGLVNARELSTSDLSELIPVFSPTYEYVPTSLKAEIDIALQNRPEIKAAMQQVEAGAARLGISQHEMLPVLNLITQTYVNGLQGNNNFGGAFVDQFAAGAPSYSIGIQYQVPIGNRLSRARAERRSAELRQLENQFRQAIDVISTEVDIAVREYDTAFREINAKSRALIAANAETETIQKRWLGMVDGNGTASLNLESLLRAQERVTEAEREYVTAVLTYNLAEMNLKKTNGTLLVAEAISLESYGLPPQSHVLAVVSDENQQRTALTFRTKTKTSRR